MSDVARLRPSQPVPPARGAVYRADGLWGDRTLAEGLETAAARDAQKIALVDNHRSLTYGELADAVGGGVAMLAAGHVGTGAGVVLVAGNTVEAVVAYHALLRVGAVIVMLDRRCGAADLRFALGAVQGTETVVVSAAEHERLAEELIGVQVVPLEAFADGGSATTVPWVEPDRDEPTVVLFTSGTTSRPKGVLHSINTLTAGARNMATITRTDEATVVFLVSPVASITGVMQMHLAADRHARLVLEDAFDAETSLDRINTSGATLLGGAPVIAEHLLRAADGRADGRIALHTLALGGAMLPRPLLQLATDRYRIEIARVYGSSELPIATGSLPEDPRERRLADDGAVMPGTEVRVGSAQHPQEGMLRGPNMFLGYLDPADNAGAFEDDWYRTGDLVDFADGRLTVIGRLKEVVNRNGLKISLSEIEGHLTDLPGARELAAFALPDPATGERLALAVVPEAGAAVTLDAVIAHLVAAGAATRKLPEQLVTWDEPLPRTTSGKVVRARLAMDAPSKRSDLAARLTVDDA